MFSSWRLSDNPTVINYYPLKTREHEPPLDLVSKPGEPDTPPPDYSEEICDPTFAEWYGLDGGVLVDDFQISTLSRK